jgi:beta-galactosidase
MEQQPGPVNWAPYNPAPLPGMVRLWTWEAFAHGAEVVSYFRWRQAPMAQEQMHAGLLRPDSADAPAMAEVREVAAELAEAGEVAPVQAPVAIMFDYDADWAWNVQPHGKALDYLWLVFDQYRALRALGQSIDILPPTTRDFAGYRLISVPGMMHVPEDLKVALAASEATVVFGPRTAARTASMAIPVPLPPAIPGLDVTVAQVESLRPDMPEPLDGGGALVGYREELDGGAEARLRTQNGTAVMVSQGHLNYLGAWLDQPGFKRLFTELGVAAGLDLLDLPEGVRVRETGTERFWFNTDTQAHEVAGRRLNAVSVLREPR